MTTATTTKESPAVPFAHRLAQKLEEALAADTTDFRELDEVMAAGVRAGHLAEAPRQALHRQLILALAEKAEDQGDGDSAWIREAVDLFLARAG